jgi:hypothetical protein
MTQSLYPCRKFIRYFGPMQSASSMKVGPTFIKIGKALL